METMDVRASPYGKLLDARSALLSRAHWWMEGARRRRSGGASAALSLPGVQPKPPQPSCSTHSATDPTTHRLASPSQNRSGCAYSPRKNQWFPFHRLSLHRSPPPLSILVQHGTEWLLFVFSLLHWLSSDLALCTPILPPPLRPPSIMSSSIPSLSLSLSLSLSILYNDDDDCLCCCWKTVVVCHSIRCCSTAFLPPTHTTHTTHL